MSQYKLIFIIGSCINVDNSPLSYFHTRSVFSNEERFLQTLETLDVIKQKIPNVYIILANNNSLTPEQRTILNTKIDKLVSIEDDVIRTHPNKSFSECAILYKAVQVILDEKIAFDYIFKTSGRYRLLEDFNIENWPFNNTKIVGPMAGNGVANCILYSVSKYMIYYYMERLKRCIDLCYNDTDNKHCVENALFDYTNTQVHEFLTIPAHVGGMCAVQNRVWWSC